MNEVTTAPAPATTTVATEYSQTEAGLAALRGRLKDVVYDVKTSTGMEAARKDRRECVTLRTGLEKLRLEKNADDQARIKRRNEEAKRITLEIESLETPIDEQIETEEQRVADEKAARLAAEQRRVDGIHERLATLRAFENAVLLPTSAEIAEKIRELVALEPDEPTFQEFLVQARLVRAETLVRLRAVYDKRLADEQERARLAVERAELERQRAAQEAEEAAARARIAEEERTAKAARDAADTAARAAREEEDRVARARLAAAEKAIAERQEADRQAREALEQREAAIRRQEEEAAAAERAAAERTARAAREAEERRQAEERRAQQQREDDARRARQQREDEERAVRQAAELAEQRASDPMVALTRLRALAKDKTVSTTALRAAVIDTCDRVLNATPDTIRAAGERAVQAMPEAVQ